MRTCDVVVVGSGAGGLAAAVTARKHGLDVVVLEKEPMFGGTTARSGGWMWVPGNPLAKRQGIADSAEAIRAYIKHEAGNHYDEARVEAFLDNGPHMVEFFESGTDVQFVLGPTFADYHSEAPGAAVGGRSICAAPFDARNLGAKVKQLRPPLREITLLGMMVGTGKEMDHFFNATRSFRSARFVAKKLVLYARDVLLHGRPMRLTNGNALVARLAKSALDLGIPIEVSTPVTELIRESDGSVRGVLIAAHSTTGRIEARRGVILACGGFPLDVERRRIMFPHAPTGAEHWSPAPPGNTGDGLRLGEAAGACVENTLPNAAAWSVVSCIPYADGRTGIFPHFVDRAKPGFIAVTNQGVRFVNEANSYHDFVPAMVRACRGAGEAAAFLVCDHRAIRRYGIGFVKPAPLPLGPHLRSGYLLRGDSPKRLAESAGIDPAAFVRTVKEFNRTAREGRDPEFGRGSTAYNRCYGDPCHGPNPCVAPLETAPFYAVKVVPGDLGTFAGLRTDRSARVLNRADLPIPGLYAVGNDMATVFGGAYPGGGTTLGPAMTFGYIAGRHLAGIEA